MIKEKRGQSEMKKSTGRRIKVKTVRQLLERQERREFFRLKQNPSKFRSVWVMDERRKVTPDKSVTKKLSTMER